MYINNRSTFLCFFNPTSPGYKINASALCEHTAGDKNVIYLERWQRLIDAHKHHGQYWPMHKLTFLSNIYYEVDLDGEPAEMNFSFADINSLTRKMYVFRLEVDVLTR